jgi:putative membrane protein
MHLSDVDRNAALAMTASVRLRYRLAHLTTMATYQRSILKGAAAGFVGGLAGAGAKALAEQLFPPRAHGQTPASVVLAEQVAGHPLPPAHKQAAMQSIHWGFGALAGAVYGAMVEVEPSLSAWRGAAFGLTLNKITHESVLPRMGLSAPKEEQPPQERISEWVTHAVYGVFTDTVRRVVRRSL